MQGARHLALLPVAARQQRPEAGSDSAVRRTSPRACLGCGGGRPSAGALWMGCIFGKSQRVENSEAPGEKEKGESKTGSSSPSDLLCGVWYSSAGGKRGTRNELWQTGRRSYDVYSISEEKVWASLKTIGPVTDVEGFAVQLVNKHTGETTGGRFKPTRQAVGFVDAGGVKGDTLTWEDEDMWEHTTKSFEVGPSDHATLMVVPLDNTSFQKCVKSTFVDRRIEVA